MPIEVCATDIRTIFIYLFIYFYLFTEEDFNIIPVPNLMFVVVIVVVEHRTVLDWLCMMYDDNIFCDYGY